MEGKFHFAIDRGGTFTDIWCLRPDGSIIQTKLLSEDPKNYSDAPREGIRRIIEQVLSSKQLVVSLSPRLSHSFFPSSTEVL